MKKDLSKRLKSIIRDLAAKAHERELGKHLERLSESLARWKKGAIDTWEMMRELDHLRFNSNKLAQKYPRSSMTPLVVASAIAAGLLRKNDVPQEVLVTLESEIRYFQDEFANGTLSLEDEVD